MLLPLRAAALVGDRYAVRFLGAAACEAALVGDRYAVRFLGAAACEAALVGDRRSFASRNILRNVRV